MSQQILPPINTAIQTQSKLPEVELRTSMKAKFLCAQGLTTEQQKNLDVMNQQLFEICEDLQPVFFDLVVKMFALKYKP